MPIRFGLLASFLILGGCETVKVQGVDITEERALALTVGLVATGIVVAAVADAQNNDQPEKCLDFQSVPPGKTTEPICRNEN